MRHDSKVLIVEDHKESSLWISAVLQRYGYKTIEAGDGTFGVRLARKERPDAILLDIHLPAGSGFFVLESLKKFEETRTIPIIVMTGDVELNYEELRALGAAAMFKKPMEVQSFVETLATIIKNYRDTQVVLAG